MIQVTGSADTLLVYLTLYISQCLTKIVRKSKLEAAKILYANSLANFYLPGERGFVLGGFTTAPASRSDADTLKAYLTQCRQELGNRLIEKYRKNLCILFPSSYICRVYQKNDQVPDKWWMLFAKRKFLDMALE